MAHYLIEFRFQSKRIRTYIESMIYGINKTFGVGKKKHIPHITLVGPIETKKEQKLIYDFARICSETPLMKFKSRGFGTFDSNRVVFVDISAGEKLNEFRIKLTEALKSYCSLPQHNKRKEGDKFGYHSTLAMKLTPEKFNSIKNYIKNKPAPDFTQIVMRVTLLKDGKILREYDFLQRRLFNRKQALNKQITKRSKILLKKFMQGTYNPNIRTENKPTKTGQSKSLFKKIISFFTENHS